MKNPGKKQTSPTSKTDAQHRADQIRYFQDELELIEHESIVSLTKKQRSAIAAYHEKLLSHLSDLFDIDISKREKQLSLGMKIASFLGALGLAASVFFLFYQFWGRFSTDVQVLILSASPIMALAVTMVAARRERTGYFSKLFGMVAFACFVLNLSMFWQIFNIIPSYTAFLAWGAFALILAYASNTRLLLAAGIICLALFLSAQAGTWTGVYWIHFGERPENFLLPAALIFFLPYCIPHRKFTGFEVIYRVFGMLFFFIPVLILANWGRISYIQINNSTIEVLYQIAGFLFSASAIWLGIRKNWPDVINTGNVFFVLFLYTKFFDWWWDWMPKYLFFLVIGLTAILALFILKRLRKTGIDNGEEG
ncbi:MAG: DUF2157 domain-containing protein [Deltaproteobacteria bacterium]|nr:DUF2157 domain-containing protein [Deltaproteobacteria bacterium]